jgi:exosortase H (IPTLxxWG-CTERM-specific)
MARFFAIFLVLLAFGVALMTRPEVSQAVSAPWGEFLADVAHRVIALWHSSTLREGNVIRDSNTGFAVSVDAECTGIDPVLIFWAAVLAFKTGWKHKMAGLAIALVGLQSLNFMRILSLYFTGLWDRTIFIWSHHNLWQGVMMLGAVLLFYIWLRLGGNRDLERHRDDPRSA